MKSILAFSLAITAVAIFLFASNIHQNESTDILMTEYQTYKLQYSKRYTSSTENLYRFNLYKKFLTLMNQHNSNPKNTWSIGINQFSDLTQEQFIKTYLGEKQPTEVKIVDDSITVGDIDWRNQNVITSVKNQGQCGSCWAFAATAVHESFHVMRNGAPLSLALSPQQLVDCANISPYFNEGCNGGWGVRALQYIKDFGQTTEAAYPYKALTQTCTQSTGEYQIPGVAEVTGCQNMESMLKITPLAVRVDASNWHLYKSGIFNNCNKSINHAVLLVGSSDQAWTIKNSWGVTWGETGYIRLAKGDTCAVCYGPSFPF